jgi:predicted nucleic acid-binding protein
MTYALDTNIISYLLQDRRDIQNRVREAISEGNSLIIPPLAYYEIRRGLLFRGAPVKTAAFERLCTAFAVGEMTLGVFDEAARQYSRLRLSGHPIDDSDLLIAAFCIVNGYILVTNNAKHFEIINGLRFENWLIP